MTINEAIINAVSDIAPCFPREAYVGNEDEKLGKYFVFNYNSRPYYFGNDAPVFDQVSIQLHFFLPLGENAIKTRREIRKRIYDTGVFTFPEEINGSDSEGQYYLYEFYGLDNAIFDDEKDGDDDSDNETENEPDDESENTDTDIGDDETWPD